MGENGDELNKISNFNLQSGQIAHSLSLYSFTLFLQPKTSLTQGMMDEFEVFGADIESVEELLEGVDTAANVFISVLAFCLVLMLHCFVRLTKKHVFIPLRLLLTTRPPQVESLYVIHRNVPAITSILQLLSAR